MRNRSLIESLYVNLPIARPGSAGAYILTALIVAFATVARLAIDRWISGSQFIFFFPAVMIATFLFGVRAGSIAVVLSTVSAFYFILPPRFTFQLTGLPEATALTVFALVASGDVLIIGLLRAALVKLLLVKGLDAALFDSNPDAVIATDKAGVITRANRQAEVMLAYPPGALLNRSVEELVPEALRDRHAAHRKGFAADPQVREMGKGLNLLARRADGETFPVDVQIGPVAGEGELRFIATIRDIGQQVAAERSLAESRQFQAVLEERERGAEELRHVNATLSAVIEAAPIAISAIDVEGRITMWNTRVAEFYGVPASVAIGQSWHETIKEQLPPDSYSTEELIRMAGKENLRNVAVKRFAPDGTVRELSVSSAPLYDGGSTIRAHLFIAHDVTQTNALERKLRKAQKLEAIGQLTGGIAHDFNNLLAAIYGNLEAAKDEADLDPRVERLLESSMKAARHGAELTRRLLAFSRQQKLEPTDVDVAAIIVGTAEMLRRVVEESIVIETVIQPDLWKSRIDAEQLTNGLINLVVNARDAMPEGGRLTITAGNVTLDESACEGSRDLTPGAYVRLSVCDTGAGMSREVQERVLEPFFTTKPVGKGTGLGLSMVYGFMKQSGGHVTIESERGRGTTVTLFLPKVISDAAAVPIDRQATESGATEGEVILLVEDDETVREVQVQSLRKLGYATREAPDGPACLEILKTSARVDLLLSDIILPAGMSGPALAEAARRIRPGLKVVFMSGYAPADILRSHNLAGARWLTKPFSRAELGEAIRTELAKDRPA
jgi:PAS domain S-box-containing protein